MKQSAPNPKVGQTLYLVPYKQGNRSRCGIEPHEVTVKTVGRKYFTVGKPGDDSPHMQDKCHLESWEHNAGEYSAEFQLYATEQDYKNQVEANNMRNSLRDFFTNYGDADIPVWKLRSIAQTLGILE